MKLMKPIFFVLVMIVSHTQVCGEFTKEKKDDAKKLNDGLSNTVNSFNV